MPSETKQLKVFCQCRNLYSISTAHSFPSTMEIRRGLVRTIFTRCTETHMSPTIIIQYLLLLCFHFPVCFTRDTITPNETISGQHGETLISAGERFELGFFRMKSSPSRYVGIWYYRSNPKIIVWVANRDKPLSDDAGVFTLAEDGNLKVLDGNKKAYWSTKLEGGVSFKGTMRLLDSGNLVLSKEDERSGSLRVIWQSFDEPTDTFLPGMKMNENLKLISWKNAGDPATGDFTFQQDEQEENQYSIKKEKSTVYWRSGVSGKFITSDVFLVISCMLSNSTGSTINMKNLFRNNSTSSEIITSSILNKNNSRLVMNSGGQAQYFTRSNESAPWESPWSEPKDPCSIYNYCGNFASCSIKNTPLCNCLPGFKPVSPDSWNSKDYSEGCRREAPLCKNDHKRGCFLGFNVTKVKKPDNDFDTGNKSECEEDCLKGCACQAYAYEEPRPRDQKGRCWLWTENFNNIQQGDIGEGREIQLRLRHPDIGDHTPPDGVIHGKKTNRTWIVVAVTLATVIVLAYSITHIYIRKRKVKTQGDRESTLALHLHDSQKHVQDLIDSGQLKEEDKKGIDLPFFDFKSILAATNSFSDENKLGKGGFGPVYKGRFPGGQEIAVKRLSNFSGQGLDEFKNEIVLIARLQHRNLVRLLGYCLEGDEKILLYEYMPNKSLDFFIFDRTLSMLLDWEMRFNIILGIARGLLYLHQDSRLRIIHRDLKTSNILLDQEMNPKISDFGLARIFEGKQTEGTTARVVGTYGYMSPEYALEGFFSVKSDVFSFGVVVLEIISGRRNTGFYNSVEALSLLGYAWKLWQEDKALDMMDQQLRASSKTNEILKCINIGLLCVQEDPNDRPTMSNVVVMLSSETMALPTPKQPAFILRRGSSSTASSSSKPESNTQLTVTLDGR